MQNLQFPTNIQELQKTIKIAIEKYQGSPVKNQNKLNESVALGLGFKNYDSLSAALNNIVEADEEDELTPMTVNYHCGSNDLIINGIYVDPYIFDEELVDYKLVDREDTIQNLIMFISEAQNNPDRQGDLFLMREDLDMLLGWNDEYVFSSFSTNEFVSPTEHTQEFNDICNEILEINEKLESDFHKITES